MGRQIGAYDAKTRLPQLLRDVERGERITITVRGRPVAELIPARADAPTAADAVAAMRAFKRVRGVQPDAVAEWIQEGRR